MALTAHDPGNRGSVAEIEHRVQSSTGLTPRDTLAKMREALDELHRLRKEEARLHAELATYRARFNYPSHWEHERKAKLETLKESRRREMGGRGEKVTEGALDSHAHAHMEYLAFLDTSYRQRQEKERLESDLYRIQGQIETLQGVVAWYDKNNRLDEELVRVHRTELGMD